MVEINAEDAANFTEFGTQLLNDPEGGTRGGDGSNLILIRHNGHSVSVNQSFMANMGTLDGIYPPGATMFFEPGATVKEIIGTREELSIDVDSESYSANWMLVSEANGVPTKVLWRTRDTNNGGNGVPLRLSPDAKTATNTFVDYLHHGYRDMQTGIDYPAQQAEFTVLHPEIFQKLSNYIGKNLLYAPYYPEYGEHQPAPIEDRIGLGIDVRQFGIAAWADPALNAMLDNSVIIRPVADGVNAIITPLDNSNKVLEWLWGFKTLQVMNTYPWNTVINKRVQHWTQGEYDVRPELHNVVPWNGIPDVNAAQTRAGAQYNRTVQNRAAQRHYNVKSAKGHRH
jgi:hypothetical protein